jgi:hypothetical protein
VYLARQAKSVPAAGVLSAITVPTTLITPSNNTFTPSQNNSSLLETVDLVSLLMELDLSRRNRMLTVDFQPIILVTSTTSSLGIPWAPNKSEEMARKCFIPSPPSKFCTTTLALLKILR